MLVSWHSEARSIIPENDVFDLPYSIKDDEHDRQTGKHQHFPNVYPRPEDVFPKVVDFNKLMVSSLNKMRQQKRNHQQQLLRKKIYIVRDKEDTDENVQAAPILHQLRGDLLFKQKNYLIDCPGMLTEEVANIIIPFHILTGSDHLFWPWQKTTVAKSNSWSREKRPFSTCWQEH